MMHEDKQTENREVETGKQMRSGIPRHRKDAMIAAAVTFAVALLLLLLLFFKSLHYDREALAETSTPELMDDEEIYLEPELLEVGNEGETDLKEPEEAAPQPPGNPDPAEEEQPKQVVKNLEPPKEEPVSSKPKLISTPEPSDVKTSTPKKNEDEARNIASSKVKFKTDNNGSPTGKEGATSSSGGNGVSSSGALKGRQMISCPSWKVTVTSKTTVTVSVTVDANGNVTAATAKSGGTPNLRTQCEKMAKGSKWTPKAGAAPATGTITFIVSPS